MEILNLLKNTLRIDGDYEDEYLNTLIESSKEFLENAGVKQNDSKTLYKIAVVKIATEWYMNREINTELPRGIVGIINQLRYSCEEGV